MFHSVIIDRFKFARFAVAAFALSLFFSTLPLLRAEPIPSELRQGSFSADKATINEALELVRAGWVYVMPAPKSPQAAWGNRDGRTTWWVGYWTNSKTRDSSTQKPAKRDGAWVGDGQGYRIWRRGGSPPPPTKIEWLCSKMGGIEPRR